jgi:DNA end-binding protein Ku
MKSKGVVKALDDDKKTPEDGATNVVDFVSLLKRSLATNKRTPAKRSVEAVVDTKPKRKVAKRPAAKKAKASSPFRRKRA